MFLQIFFTRKNRITDRTYLKVQSCIYLFILIFFNWDSLHASLNSYHEVWSYKKKKHKKDYSKQEICLERTYS